MDEAYICLLRFRSALAAFHERVLAGQRELERCRDGFAGQWQDANRRWHDERWLPQEEELKHFLDKESPEYLEFLDDRIRALKGYLEG